MQFPADFFNNFNSAFDNVATGSGSVSSIGSGSQAANAIGSGNQNAFASGTNNAQASAVSGAGEQSSDSVRIPVCRRSSLYLLRSYVTHSASPSFASCDIALGAVMYSKVFGKGL